MEGVVIVLLLSFVAYGLVKYNKYKNEQDIEQVESLAKRLNNLLNTDIIQQQCNLAKCPKFNKALRNRIEKYGSQVEKRKPKPNTCGGKQYSEIKYLTAPSHDLLIETLVILLYFREMSSSYIDPLTADEIANKFKTGIQESLSKHKAAKKDPFISSKTKRDKAQFNFSADLAFYKNSCSDFSVASACDPLLSTPEGFEKVNKSMISARQSSYQNFGISFVDDVIPTSHLSKRLARVLEEKRLRSHQDIESIILGFLLDTLVKTDDIKALNLKWISRRAYSPRQLEKRPLI